MAIGERIHFFRILRGMTQKYLGTIVGFPERSAVQQHDEQTGDAGVCHPQDGGREAEHEVQRLGDGSQRGGKRQRHQNGSGLFAVFLTNRKF